MSSLGDTFYTPITNSNNAKDVTVCVGLVVGARLDFETLQRAASDLIQQWPLLGGSIVKNTSPWSFTTGTKIDFQRRNIEKKVDELFQQLPFHTTFSDAPTYMKQPGNGHDHDRLFHFDNYRLYNPTTDGLFSIRATILTDATLLGFRSPHYLVNAQTLSDMIHAYVQVLNGQKNLPSLTWPPDSNSDKPLSSLIVLDNKQKEHGKSLEEKHKHLTAGECNNVGLMAGLPMILTMIFGSLLSLIVKSRALEERFIYLPSKLVEKWQGDAQMEAGGDVRLSKMDVVTAWFLKATFSTTPPDDDPLAVMYPMSYRALLPTAPPDTHWLKNTTYEMVIHWDKFSTFQTSSLPVIASAIRSKVIACKDPSVVKSSLQFLEENRAALVTPGLRGKNRFDRVPIVSSWGEDFYRIDFSKAMVKSGSGEVGVERRAKVLFVMPRNIFPGGLAAKGLAFVVKDAGGGYWLRATLGKNEWEGHGLGNI